MTCKDCGTAPRAPGRSRCYPCYGVHRNQNQPKNLAPKILYIDIETTPMGAWVWGAWDQNISISQMREAPRVMCFSARWQGGKNEFYSEWDHGHDGMILKAYELLDEADHVVHYYGSKFDVPHLNTEFLRGGYPPPAPFKQVDLKFAVSKNFKLPSNKLQYVSTLLGTDGKDKMEFEDWLGCMYGNKKAQKKMEKYNRKDVDLLDELYNRLLPWIPSLPNRNLWDGKGCVACGSEFVQKDGKYHTSMSVYDRYLCLVCGKWMRGVSRTGGVKLQGAVL